MTRLSWNAPGTRYFEAGVDRGVLYVDSLPGVPWSGLISVEESPTGGEVKSYYIDGVKYMHIVSDEEYAATINAFTYPNLFATCDGTAQVRNGLYLTQQRRKSFGFSYRTGVGNDVDGPEHAYKLHLVYNALASPSQKTVNTLGDSSEVSEFSWSITTKPPAMAGYKRTSHVVIDSRHTDPLHLQQVEDILYGTDLSNARLPSFTELVEIFDVITTLTLTDNGDGTFTAVGPPSAINILDPNHFELTWPTADMVDEDTWTVIT